MNNKILIFLSLIVIYACNKDSNLEYTCDKNSNYFCILTKKKSESSSTFEKIEKAFKFHKLTYLKKSKEWISFNISETFDVDIKNLNGKVNFEIYINTFSIEDYDQELVDDYLNSLTEFLGQKNILNDDEILFLKGIHLPVSWGKKNKYPPPSLNNLLDKNDLYYINDNFNF